jgi:hypothetical protein
MENSTFRTLSRLGILFAAIVALAGLLAVRPSPSQAAPEAATALTIANISAAAADCVFDAGCAAFPGNMASSFGFSFTSGAGFLQSRTLPRGEVGTAGAGLYAYEYVVDLRELVGSGNPVCVNSVTLDFGPVVPLDYDGDSSLEQAYVVTSGGAGSLAPSSIEQTGSSLTFQFPATLCSDYSPSQDNGLSSFTIGLASPFRQREVTAVVNHNQGGPLSLAAQAPAYPDALSLYVYPNEGAAGDSVQLIGASYIPGGYTGTIRWNGSDDDTFTIPDGGAFSIPYTIPASASIGAHTITVCSLSPCATGEFEQLASAAFNVREAAPPANQIFLPMITKGGAAEPFSYVVDSSVTPFQAELPEIDGEATRPLTAVRDPRGTVSTFVANEIVVQTDDAAALSAFLARTGGEVLLETDPAAAGISGLAKSYLVRVDLSTADTSSFTTDVESLMDSGVGSAGKFAFGDNSGVQLFSMAAGEAVGGLTVGVNWVDETTTIPTSSMEAPNGVTLGSVVYSPDAYNWPHFAAGTTQDIGVPEAWALMYRGGKLGNTVDIAILDGGFYPNADFPAGTTYITVFPFDPRNVDGVDGAAPFHGTSVLQTAAAVGDDNNGIVGVASPIAHPIALYTTYDFFVSIASVTLARAAGAEVINMSYSASVPVVFAWTVLPFEATTAAVRASGALLFAAAGNDGNNVDAEDCFLGVCWESTLVTPCENAGVICVGGLEWDSQRKAGNSNYGRSSVDIFAPYTVYAGQAPDRPTGNTTAGSINGTSFASPYAASVAALIWASDPSLSADQVWDIMRTTAHTSPDSNVNLYVNAYDAVLEAIGVGLNVEMSAPVEGAAYDLGYAVSLSANVGYVTVSGGVPVQARWYVDGTLLDTITYTPGVGSHTLYPTSFASGLAAGSHTALIRVTAGGTVVEKSVTFTIVNTAPTATIDQPANGDSFCPGETVTFRGSSFDPNEPGGLPDSAYAWRSNVDGSLGSGAMYSTSSLSTGAHTITLRVTDNGGLWDEDSIALTILSPTHPDCVDLSPSALITSPPNGYSVYADSFDGTYWYKQVTFTGTVSDPEDAISALTVGWYSDLQGYLGAGTVNTSTGAVSLTQNMRVYGTSCSSAHTITLRVTDTYGNITEDQIQIFINLFC